MSSERSDATTEGSGVSGRWPDVELSAVVEHYDDRPDECTIFPGDADDEEVVTRWLTAREGAYVSLQAMR